MQKMTKYFIIILLLIISLAVTACTSSKPQQVQINVAEESPIAEPIQEEISSETVQEEQIQTTASNQQIKEFKVTIGHTSYSPDSFTVKKGDKVRFLAVVASGTASHIHGITIDEFGVNEAVTTEDSNSPKIIEFVPDMAGTFSIWCKTCWDGPFGTGHPDIRATLIVEE